MKRTDAWWLLAWPIYQVIGTARHEGSHAAAALLQGAHITKIMLLPSIHPAWGRFYWGYVEWTGGHANWIATAAPYLVDLFTSAIFVLLCTRMPRMPHWLWVNFFIIGIVSPLVNTAYSYQNVFTRKCGDLYELMRQIPPTVVHPVVLVAIALLCAGTWAAIRASMKESAPISADRS